MLCYAVILLHSIKWYLLHAGLQADVLVGCEIRKANAARRKL